MTDIFEHTVLCTKCGKAMGKAVVVRNGFQLRALVCPSGHEKLIHPADEEDYKKFKELRQKEFNVKMRVVGNSYAVSIPKEIVLFMQEQEKFMNDMVRLCFEESGRLSLTFGKLIKGEEKPKLEENN